MAHAFFQSTPIHVLHIEDNLADARLVKESILEFSGNGIEITHCTKFQSALNQLVNATPDVILLDLSLPDSHGIESVERLRARVPDTALVVLTGTSNEQWGLEALKLGAQDYIIKGHSIGEVLAKTIQYAYERQRIESQSRRQALTDSLTNLPNRTHFMEFLARSMARARRINTKLTLLYLDLDGFKQINDTFGHYYGDRFLVEVGKRIQYCLRDSDFCARLGGDEFAIIADIEPSNNDFAEPLAQKILEVMRQPFNIKNGEEITPACSIGACIFSPKVNDFNQDEFIQSADEAMYRAKRAGGDGFRLHDEDLAKHSIINSSLSIQLRSALKRRQFHLNYQPIINIETGTVGGYEALLRWVNDAGESIPPGIFIPHLESNQLIRSVGEWVLNEACAQFHELDFNSNPAQWLSINVSPLQLEHANFFKSVENILAHYPSDTPWLMLEVTEGVFMNNTEQVILTLQKIKDMGVTIAIDDFGTGYSSMQYLMDLPASILKIDRSFVLHLEDSRPHQLITNGMMRLAQALGMKVIVEGVENEETVELLKKMGANYLQGFYYSKPQSLDSLKKSEPPANLRWG